MEKFLESLMIDLAKKAEAARSKDTSVDHDEVTEMKKDVTFTAKLAKMQFDQFLAVGFTEEQAMQMVIAILN